MQFQDQAGFSGPLGAPQGQIGGFPAGGVDENFRAMNAESARQPGHQYERYEQLQNKVSSPDKETFHFYGQALARDVAFERSGTWIVLGFTAAFALFLIVMNLVGQAPGKSFALKSISDILQFVGEGIGLVLCARIAIKLRGASVGLWHEVAQKAGRSSPSEIVNARNEAQAAQRAFLAWTFLTIAIALYASGQAIWTSYDIRMNSADVPFPGLYDIGFVASYPFFLVGTLLLTRRDKASVGRVRLVLDALGVIGTSLALSWFFLLGPSIASLAQAPSQGAAFLSVYFPTGDLFLVAVGAFLMFSPLSSRAQQPVFLRLCLGLFFLAITDSLLGYYSLSFSFNTGTLQDILWPLSMALIGLAAVEYPRCIAREQEQEARKQRPGMAGMASDLTLQGRLSQITTTVQTIAPFLLVLMTCAVLLAVIAPRGGAILIQADVIALALILIVIARQALTLIENNRLTMQMRGELVISRRELQVTRREADEASRTAQEKKILEEGVATLRSVHARVARGDLSARAPTIPGPLLPIAISLNLMLDRLGAVSQRGARYEHLVQESRQVQGAVERLAQGLPAWAANQPAPQSSAELRTIFLGLVQLQRFQEGQWRNLAGRFEMMAHLLRKIREALAELRRSPLLNQNQASFEQMIFERVQRETNMLNEQQNTVLQYAKQASARFNQLAVPGPESSGRGERGERGEHREHRERMERGVMTPPAQPLPQHLQSLQMSGMPVPVDMPRARQGQPERGVQNGQNGYSGHGIPRGGAAQSGRMANGQYAGGQPIGGQPVDEQMGYAGNWLYPAQPMNDKLLEPLDDLLS